jgi:hypothetical protein
MQRVLLGATLVLCTTASVFSADYPILRPSYEPGWEVNSEESLRFEAGLRYWYAWGSQHSQVGSGTTYDTRDRSHILEGHLRIDDDYTATFLKGQAGFAAVINGEHEAGNNAPNSFEGGQIGYVGADLGWTPLGTDSASFGGLVGYQFTRESPDRNRLDVENVDGLNIHALRLGVTGKADLGSMFDIEAEAVAIPYAYAHGATAEIPFATTPVQGINVNRRNTTATGALYGASGQVMLGVHPTENLTLRVGGRAWYLTGPNSAREKMWEASTPESYIYSDTELNGFSLFRYGLLAELTGRF